MSAFEALETENTLLRRLLALRDNEPPEAVLDEVLRLSVGATSARLAYAAIGNKPDAPRWWKAVGIDDDDEPEDLRARVSRTIVTASRRLGEVVLTNNAANDPRFQAESIVARGVDQVVCATVDDGVLYLQGRTANGPFTERELQLVQLIVRQLGPVFRRVRSSRRWHEDLTRPHRENLRNVEHLVGRGSAMANVLQRVAMYSRLEMNLLLTGETGTGKTKIARAIHDNSARVAGPFVSVNCARLTAERFHVAVFGSVRGAYTGSERTRVGLVHTARGGTLFLDELGELPAESQSQLLTFAESGEYRRLGEDQVRESDVRIVGATNLALPDSTGRFRRDLYERLAEGTIEAPPLRDRLDDLPELAVALVGTISRELGLPSIPLSPDAIAMLECEDWPGNIRELRRRLVDGLVWAVSEGSSAIGADYVAAPGQEPVPTTDLKVVAAAFKKRFAMRMVERCDGNKSRAADALGMSRSQLYRLIEQTDADG